MRRAEIATLLRALIKYLFVYMKIEVELALVFELLR